MLPASRVRAPEPSRGRDDVDVAGRSRQCNGPSSGDRSPRFGDRRSSSELRDNDAQQALRLRQLGETDGEIDRPATSPQGHRCRSDQRDPRRDPRLAAHDRLGGFGRHDAERGDR